MKKVVAGRTVLCNAPTALSTDTNRIFVDYMDLFLFVYLAHLLIFSKKEDECLNHLNFFHAEKIKTIILGAQGIH